MNPLARLVFPALRWRPRTGFSHERNVIAQTLKLGVGGYILFGGTIKGARELTQQLRRASPYPLLIGSDFERGAGQQITGLTDLPPPAALGFIGKPALTARCGAITAREAMSVGVNWVFAPVADLDAEPENPIVQTRSFGDVPATVSDHVTHWIIAAQKEGATATAKHYPGHGRTLTDSHATLPRVDASFETLAANDLAPFQAAVAAGARSVMSAHVAYPGWDPSGLPATLSQPILDYLRTSLGFDGLIVTDALIMEGALRGGSGENASVQAIAAGADALLYPSDPVRVVHALEAARDKTLTAERLDEARERVEKLAAEASVASHVARSGAVPSSNDQAFAAAVADLSTHVLRGDHLNLRGPIQVTPIDDDVGGPYVIHGRDVFARTLRELGVRSAPGGSRAVIVFSEPRSWKSRAGFGPATVEALNRVAPHAALFILFGHPRLLAGLPEGPPVLCAWHGQALMQAAAARWVVKRL
ncbi:MAG TPA: glycoside hydrolase family 3 N-terminal domain-containing protein [Gemmatimonadales bacterium]